MSPDLPGVRILPMSDRLEGFRELSIPQVQARYFLRLFPQRGGRFHYPRAGLNAVSGTVVLFQFRARIIASGTFVRDEKFDRPRRGYAGVMHFDPASFCVFDPVGVDAMRRSWPGFRGFGHVKQFLNPGGYPSFKRRLKDVCVPEPRDNS